jgi:glycosyltransferase involved in cell wall biosynthesis
MALARHTGPSGYRISTLFFEDGPLRTEMEREGILADVVPWKGSIKDTLGALRTWNWMRKHPAQIVHVHGGGHMIRTLARNTGAAAVIEHVHGLVIEPDLSPLSCLKFSGADAVISCSRAVADSLCETHSEVIYAGVDIDPNPPAPPSCVGPMRVGVLARLVPLKRIEAVIEAHSKLALMGIDVETDICGEGSSELLLRDLAKRLGVVDKVRFLGWRNDTAALLASWDLLVMPSMYEGLPIAALEAMAAGRAVVASRVGGLPELIDDGVSGILIPAGDTDALIRAIRALAADRSELSKIGYEGWKRASALFSSDRMSKQIIALYNRLLRR